MKYRDCQFEHCPDEKAESVEHLDFAMKEFQEMKMPPALEKARALKKNLCID